MKSHIRKLVLPVAGIGKRLRPLTLRRPKALVPVGGRPLLDYVLDEARGTSIREVILIASPRHKRHFEKWIASERSRYPEFSFSMRYQEHPGGNGHAVIQAYDLFPNEPVAVRFCDDILPDRPSLLASLLALYGRLQGSIVLLERVPRKDVSRYGVVAAREIRISKEGIRGKVYRITDILEKPSLSRAPSNLTIVGGYVLTASVLRNLQKVVSSLPGIAADALPVAIGLQIDFILKNPVYGWEFSGNRLDCGTLDGLAKAAAFLEKSQRLTR